MLAPERVQVPVPVYCNGLAVAVLPLEIMPVTVTFPVPAKTPVRLVPLLASA